MTALIICCIIWGSIILFVWALPKILEAILWYYERRCKQLEGYNRQMAVLKGIKSGAIKIELTGGDIIFKGAKK